MKALLHLAAVSAATHMKEGEYKDYYKRKTKEELFRRLDDGEVDVMCDFFFDYNWAHEHRMNITNPYLIVNYVLVHRRNENIPASPVIAAPRSRNFTRQYVFCRRFFL